MISLELEQCIGRSGLLRTDAAVYLFSNFPCEQPQIILDDYLNLPNDNSADTSNS